MATKRGLPETREEVLLLLINRKEPQAYNSDEECCTYLHNINGGCAIGQCLSKSQAINVEGDVSLSVITVFTANLLPKRLAKLGVQFLDSVQRVHDNGDLWEDEDNADISTETGLVWNEEGIREINNIIRVYNLKLDLLTVKSLS